MDLFQNKKRSEYQRNVLTLIQNRGEIQYPAIATLAENYNYFLSHDKKQVTMIKYYKMYKITVIKSVIRLHLQLSH